MRTLYFVVHTVQRIWSLYFVCFVRFWAWPFFLDIFPSWLARSLQRWLQLMLWRSSLNSQATHFTRPANLVFFQWTSYILRFDTRRLFFVHSSLNVVICSGKSLHWIDHQDVIATGGIDTTAVLFDRPSGQILSTLTGHSKKVRIFRSFLNFPSSLVLWLTRIVPYAGYEY